MRVTENRINLKLQLQTLDAIEIPRKDYLKQLAAAVDGGCRF
jgi:hypothetical protein